MDIGGTLFKALSADSVTKASVGGEETAEAEKGAVQTGILHEKGPISRDFAQLSERAVSRPGEPISESVADYISA